MDLIEYIDGLPWINHVSGWLSVSDFAEIVDYKKIDPDGLKKDFKEISKGKMDLDFEFDGEAISVDLTDRSPEELLWVLISLHRIFYFKYFSVDVNVSPDEFYQIVVRYNTGSPTGCEGIQLNLLKPIDGNDFRRIKREIKEQIGEFSEIGLSIAPPEDHVGKFPIDDYLQLKGKNLDLFAMDGEVSDLQEIVPMLSVDVRIFAPVR